mmetsp:Transcript_29837/g.69762  ORF Transcript_29837/g.69762 Transcript_29837/m.69762 type:complete len:121 (-) Transcript_29837:96-458(-)
MMAPNRPPDSSGLAYTRPFSKAAGSRVGVLLEMQPGRGRLSFWGDGRPLGVAFADLPHGPFWPLLELTHAGDSATLHAGADVLPPSRSVPTAAELAQALAGLALASNAAPALAKMQLPPV